VYDIGSEVVVEISSVAGRPRAALVLTVITGLVEETVLSNTIPPEDVTASVMS
jgi:hypothetical protein